MNRRKRRTRKLDEARERARGRAPVEERAPAGWNTASEQLEHARHVLALWEFATERILEAGLGGDITEPARIECPDGQRIRIREEATEEVARILCGLGMAAEDKVVDLGGPAPPEKTPPAFPLPTHVPRYAYRVVDWDRLSYEQPSPRAMACKPKVKRPGNGAARKPNGGTSPG